MQVHAIYEDGRLTFQQPVRLKAQRIELDVNIPDNYIEEELHIELESVTEQVADVGNAQSLSVSPTRERLNSILGPLRGKFGSITPQEVKQIWHEHLEEKYLGSKR